MNYKDKWVLTSFGDYKLSLGTVTILVGEWNLLFNNPGSYWYEIYLSIPEKTAVRILTGNDKKAGKSLEQCKEDALAAFLEWKESIG